MSRSCLDLHNGSHITYHHKPRHHPLIDELFPWSRQPCIPMANRDEEPIEGSPISSPSTSRESSRESSVRPRPGPANVFEFVDSHNPKVKSVIQRHTAYHQAAQRREARLQSLRRGSSQSRYLEWGRRQSPESIIPMSSPSLLPSPGPLEPTTTPGNAKADSIASSPQLEGSSDSLLQAPDVQSLSRRASQETTPLLASSEEALLQFCRDYIRSQHRTVPSYQDSVTAFQDPSSTSIEASSVGINNRSRGTSNTQIYDATIAFIRLDEACTQLLLAYSHSLRTSIHSSDSDRERDNQAAHRYLSRGTAILRSRLRDSQNAASDANIQAVLSSSLPHF